MALPALQTITGFTDPLVQTLEDNLGKSLRPVLKVPMLDGVLIQNITLNSATTTLIPHGLGRGWVGWVIVDQQQAANVWRSTAVVVPTSILPLIASASTTLNVWVF